MRVLDTACGGGETTLLAARLVGATGYAVGVDRSHGALRTARQIADLACVENVEFRESDGEFEELFAGPPFDAVVGRNFLIHQGEPAVVLRKLSRLVRPGGLVAFLEQELDYGHHTEPAAGLVDQTVAWIQAADRESGRQLHVVTSFPRLFLEAGLEWPKMRAYQAAWGSEAAGACETLAARIDEMMPLVERRRRLEMETAQLATRLSTEVKECGGAWVAAPTAGAWARVR